MSWLADGALLLLLALWGVAIWAVWRKHIVDDLHAVRVLLEERSVWDREIAELMRELVEVGNEALRRDDERQG